MIIKDDDPESPVRTKTSLLTRETPPSGSRVAILGGPRCRPPTVPCAKLDATTAFLTIQIYPVSSVQRPVFSVSCVLKRLGSEVHTIQPAHNYLDHITMIANISPSGQRCSRLLTPSMTQNFRYKLQVPRNLKSRLWSYPPLSPGRGKR